MGINCMVYLMDLRLLVRCLRLLELYDCLFSFCCVDVFAVC